MACVKRQFFFLEQLSEWKDRTEINDSADIFQVFVFEYNFI